MVRRHRPRTSSPGSGPATRRVVGEHPADDRRSPTMGVPLRSPGNSSRPRGAPRRRPPTIHSTWVPPPPTDFPSTGIIPGCRRPTAQAGITRGVMTWQSPTLDVNAADTGSECHVLHLGDLGVGDQLTGVGIGDPTGVMDAGYRVG